MKADNKGNLIDTINPILDLKPLTRKQVKELAKEIADNKSDTHVWQEVLNNAVTYNTKNNKQEKRFKRIFNKQLNENLAPILEKQHKQELIDRMKSGDTSAMEQWTSEGIDKFGHQFMPILLGAATAPFALGATGAAIGTYGAVPALTAEATSAGLGHVGYKLGSHLDDNFGTNWIAPVTALVAGVGGYHGGISAGMKAIDTHTINQAFKSGQLKYGQPTAYTAYHQSSTPITKFKFPFKERWDVRTHGADPNGAFFTVGKPAGSGFLAERPYTGQFHIKVQKPLIQTGELSGPTKNGLRNAIVRRARRDGADAVFFDGIADNQLQNQQILFAMDNADIGYRGMVGTPFKQGNWQSPKSIRNQVLNGHLKGDDAIQMFKDYGVVSIPANSKIYSDIQKLVPEARERYGLVGHSGITDDEIAGSLYKRAMELNGEGNAAVWETGEPKLLFRGDTRRYNKLLHRPEPEQLTGGTADNALGNLFLGELPGLDEWGIERYLHRVEPSYYGRGESLWLSATGEGIKHGNETLKYIPGDLANAYGQIYAPKTTRSFGQVKLLPAKISVGGGNDINPFIVRAKNLRDISDEVSVGADHALLKSKGITSTDGVQKAVLKYYRSVLDDAKINNQGLFESKPYSPFRPDEHEIHTYYALPNFNRQNAKHLFGWDLRRPVQWDVDNIYLEKGGKIENPDH